MIDKNALITITLDSGQPLEMKVGEALRAYELAMKKSMESWTDVHVGRCEKQCPTCSGRKTK